MNQFLQFVTTPLPGAVLTATYNSWMVALSFLVAALASYTAIDLAGRVHEFSAERRQAAGWLAGGAVAMGAGIWSMHFVGMLAYQLPIPVRYDLWVTLASMALVIITSGFALFIVTRRPLAPVQLLLGGTIMGAGIGAMHYTGMAAMRLDALVMYYTGPFALSVVNAVACSTAALWLVSRRTGANVRSKVLAALVMGVAISGMHYTGMYATVFVAAGSGAVTVAGIDPALLALAITVITLLIIGMALAVSLQSQLMSQALREQNQMLRAEIGQRRQIETELQNHQGNLQAIVDERTRALSQANSNLLLGERRFRATFEQAALGMVHIEAGTYRILMANERLCQMLGYTQDELIGTDSRALTPPGEMQADNERAQVIAGEIKNATAERRLMRKDGSIEWFSRSLSLVRDESGQPLYFIGVLENISVRKQAEQARAQLAAIVGASNDAIVSRDLDGRVLSWNRGAEVLFGYSAAEMIGCQISVLAPASLHGEFRIGEERAPVFEAHSHDSVRLAKDGRRIDVSISAAPIMDATGSVTAVALIFRDITDRKQSAQAQAQLAAIVETSDDAIVARAPDDIIVSWNAAAERLFGWTAKEALGQPFRRLLSHTPEVRTHGRFEKLLRGEPTAAPQEDIRRRKDGSSIHVQTTMSAVRDEQGKLLFASCIMRDVTERLKAEQHIKQLATKDALTGLANRSTLLEQMNAAIARAARSKTELVLMFIDLDRFKEVNDTFGHASGDELLRECALRLTMCVREVDIVARLGGDEFVVMLTDVIDTGIVAPIADRMLKLLTTPYQLGRHEARLSASIGICSYPADGEDATALMKNADIAMYHAKALGRNNYQFYAEDMNQRIMQRLQLERELRAAVENKEFVLHFQPQVVVATGKIQGVESLIRWRHPVRGLLPPAEFITAAEETGLILPIGEWVLNQACRTIKAWRAQGVGIPYVVVNVSAVQLGEALVTSVRQALHEHAIEANWLMLEITETMLMERVEEAISILRRIRELGVRIAMDDFGTGYSSLSVLQRLPLDTLKIDRSFVSAIGAESDESDNARACAIIGAIVAIAGELQLGVVAEGVETTTQLAFLRTLNCHAYQGYLHSKPLDARTIEAHYAQASSSSAKEDGDECGVTMNMNMTD